MAFRVPSPLLALGIVLGQFTSPAFAQQAVDPKAIDQIVRDALDSWEVPGVGIAIVHDDRVIYLKGMGVKERGTKDAVTADTVFAVASCTKAFTTTAMAMLVDQGKMSWDDPVRKYLPYFKLADPLADANCTLRDLVCHRTGLAGHDMLWYRSPWTVEEQVRRIGLVPPSKSFRSAFQYQSIMFGAAGLAVGKASDSSWAEFVQKRIFDPLEMTSASCTTTAALKNSDHTSPHRRNPDGKVAVVPWYSLEKPHPAGSINASARDLSKWLRFLLAGGTYKGQRLLAQAQLTETWMPQTIIRLEGAARADNPFTTQMSYGLGWIVMDYRGMQQITHGGWVEGQRCQITLIPQARLGIALVANMEKTRMALALSNHLVDHLLGFRAENWNGHYQARVKADEQLEKAHERLRQENRKPNTKPTHDLQAYTGSYENPAYGTAKITLDQGKLVWEWSSFRRPLDHYHYDTFLMHDDQFVPDPMVIFTLADDGAIRALRVFEMEFKKAKK